ncbi:hypothetical protein [Saccharicrinis sp. FJH54]|uniref:hypothetical protein n=1 Tax=Saccharicrinis sp. FJH54 TaxID=3344665 RepID=UPI0035D4CB72
MDTTRIEYHQVLNDSIYSLTYIPKLIDKNDTVKIIVKESKYFQPEYFYNRKKVDFEFVSSREYLIEGELFCVYKYVKNPSVIDGCVTQFWNPDFGIVIKRSSTWKDFSKLQTNSENINRIINLLFDVINQDTEFYYGCKEELELIPKSDVREFYDWKFKDELINLNE